MYNSFQIIFGNSLHITTVFKFFFIYGKFLDYSKDPNFQGIIDDCSHFYYFYNWFLVGITVVIIMNLYLKVFLLFLSEF